MKPQKVILAIDQGTTGSRAIIYGKTGVELAKAYQEFPQIYPRPGWVEHDPEVIWESVKSVVSQVQRQDNFQICAIGITNQRETTVLWDAVSGKPVANAIVWQDRRTADDCVRLNKTKAKYWVRERTGLVIDAYFSATKIKWYLDHSKRAKQLAIQGKLRFGTIDSWLIWKLTSGATHATDLTNASRTLLLNIHSQKWDGKLLKLFQVPKSCLPEIKNSGDLFGETQGAHCLPNGIPIHAVMGDQQAALYGQDCYEEGGVKNTYGTGCFIMMNAGSKKRPPVEGLLTTLASDLFGNPVYALEGAVFVAGAVMQWLRDGLHFFKKASDSEKMIRLTEDTGGVTLIPAFVGLGSPYWNSGVRGVISGLTRGTKIEHLIRAALESIAHQSADVIELMERKSSAKLKALKADGGATANHFLMQFQADILQKRLEVSSIAESTAWGVAKLAGRKCGFWPFTPFAFNRGRFRFTSKISRMQAREHRKNWRAQVEWLLKSPAI